MAALTRMKTARILEIRMDESKIKKQIESIADRILGIELEIVDVVSKISHLEKEKDRLWVRHEKEKSKHEMLKSKIEVKNG